MQQDLFDNQNTQNLREEIDKIGRSTAAVRRGLFARNTQLEKFMVELLEKHECLEREVYNLRKKVANLEGNCKSECNIYEKAM
jgi:hypothetical protein